MLQLINSQGLIWYDSSVNDSLNSQKYSEFLKHSLDWLPQTFQIDAPLASFHCKKEVPMNCFRCSNLFLNAIYERKERQVRIIHYYPPSFSSPSHWNPCYGIFTAHFIFWSILSGFKKLPNRPQSEQKNLQSLKWYFYKIKPARENTMTLVLIWEFLTLYDMDSCSARPTIRTRVLNTIYMKKPEIPAGKSHSPRHSVWEASVGCDLSQIRQL